MYPGYIIIEMIVNTPISDEQLEQTFETWVNNSYGAVKTEHGYSHYYKINYRDRDPVGKITVGFNYHLRQVAQSVALVTYQQIYKVEIVIVNRNEVSEENKKYKMPKRY